MSKIFSIALASLHLAFVIFMAATIATSTDPVAVNAWLLFLPLDFPASMGLLPLSYYVDGDFFIRSIDEFGNYSIYRDIDNFWIPAVYFGVFGSMQWYYIPKFISWACSKILCNHHP